MLYNDDYTIKNRLISRCNHILDSCEPQHSTS